MLRASHPLESGVEGALNAKGYVYWRACKESDGRCCVRCTPCSDRKFSVSTRERSYLSEDGRYPSSFLQVSARCLHLLWISILGNSKIADLQCMTPCYIIFLCWVPRF